MNSNKGNFISGIFLGMILGIFLLGVLSLTIPERFKGVDRLLNSGEYRIDTTVRIHDNDTIYYYEFVKI